jgi:hypothetical protein
VTAALDPERRAALLGVKLRALVAAHEAATGAPAAGASPAGEPVAFAGGSGWRTPDALWALVESPSSGLGAVLAWAGQVRGGTPPRGPDGGTPPEGSDGGTPPVVHVVVDGEAAPRAGALARRAALFAAVPSVWRPEGRNLVPVAPAPLPEPPAPRSAALAVLDDLRAAGLEVVVEHGIVRGEIDGLEVAVVVVDEDGAARIEVGVGRNDREAFALLHGDLPPAEAMRKVADVVRSHRRPGANSHPLNRMAPERWLRSHLLRDGGRLPGWEVDPVAGPEARTGVAATGPAYAYGRDAAGAPVVLACSVGIDLELVPAAADARALLDPGARLVLAVPERDAHAVTRRLAAALRRPAEVLAVEGDWRR